ncbi:MAG: HNH endonuclease [bacterium]|nr:HNH endonuclease [bacterium]
MSHAIVLPAFSPEQPAARVDAALREALRACDRARECAVIWFAEVQRCALFRELGFAPLETYATQALGFSANRYWQFKRLADDLDRLPVLREAVATGEVGWTKAQQVARVATSGRRELAREVAAVRAEVRLAARDRQRNGSAMNRQLALDCGTSPLAPAQVPATGAIPFTITLRGDALQVARFEALVGHADDAEVADWCASAAPAVQVVVQQCPDCAAAAAVTQRGELPLAPAQVAALGCDARVRVANGPNRATIPPKVRAVVLARDRHRCTNPGCGSTRFLEVHHVTPRSRGGTNRAENLTTLCNRCHGFAHERPVAMVAAGAGSVLAD